MVHKLYLNKLVFKNKKTGLGILLLPLFIFVTSAPRIVPIMWYALNKCVD